ncbi:DCC1-like thiol-disulfide oxidoreductase family protein [Pseudomonas zhanjiangensis]|uniref:DCC1-like thiol-disulfide oxidoreductase family protein n=1 Tax=Pseudomonas zhanjiangensis TaxID=3239015 RepID=A0ABV3YVM6_9PSED
MPMADKLKVYYDGACPRCVADRRRYEKLSAQDDSVEWVDITGRDDELRRLGIDPYCALTELHVQDGQGRIHRELDAYILLMSRTTLLRPLAWLLGLPGLKPLLSWCYRRWVLRRLRREGRL